MKKILFLILIFCILPFAHAEEKLATSASGSGAGSGASPTTTTVAQPQVTTAGLQLTSTSTVESQVNECLRKEKTKNPDGSENDAWMKCKSLYPNPIVTASGELAPECDKMNYQLEQEFEAALKKAEIAKQEKRLEQDIEEIQKYISNLKEKIEQNKKTCWQPQVVKAVSAEAPTVVGTTISSGNVVTYYQVEMEKILNEKQSVNDQITSLKELRNKIDSMIKELIEKQQSATIQAKEFTGIVEEFKIKPQEIKVGDVTVSTNKELVKEIDNQEVKIRPTESKVLLNVGNTQASTTQQVAVSDKIKVGDIELKALPDKVNVKGDIKNVEIVKEGDKLVYQVKSEQDRKILGLIAVKAETNSQFDASTPQATLIKEEKPWWFIISSEA